MTKPVKTNTAGLGIDSNTKPVVESVLPAGKNWISPRNTGCWIGGDLLVSTVVDENRNRLSRVDLHAKKANFLWTKAENCIYPVASPDSRGIAYISRSDGRRRVGIANVAGAALFVGKAADGKALDLCWSADSSRVFYLSQQGSNCDIHRVSLADRVDKVIVKERSLIGPMSINPSGLVAVGGRCANSSADRIFVFRISDGKLIAESPKTESFSTPVWSLDGGSLAYVVHVGTSPDSEIRVSDASIVGSSEWIPD